MRKRGIEAPRLYHSTGLAAAGRASCASDAGAMFGDRERG